MEFKTIKCKGCGTNQSPLFLLQPPQSGHDVWYEKCKVKELKKRAKKK